MKDSLINGKIVFKYPDSFKLMDSDVLKKHFGTSDNIFGIRNAEQHMIMSVAWNKVNMFLSMLADQKSVLNGMEKRFRGNLKEFRRTSDIAVNVCGVKAKGFTFEYIAHDADVAQVGNIVTFKLDKVFYFLQFAARKENEQEANKVFEELLASLTLNEN